MSLKYLWQCWRKFWFEPQSPMPMSIYRIFFGLLILQSALIHTLPTLSFWYGPNAITSLDSVHKFFFQKDPSFDLMLLFPNTDAGVSLFFGLFVLSAVCLTIGLCTDVSAALVCLGLISLHHHQPYNINGGDSFLRLASIFLVFSHSGATLSVDSIIGRQQGRTEHVLVNPCFQRLLQVQFAIAYWQTFCCKIVGPQWLDGTAVYYATRLDDMTKFNMPFLNNIFFCQGLSWYTLIIEFCMWTLIWFKEFRYYVLIGAFILHFGIDMTINLPVFEWAFICTLVLFIEPDDLKKWAGQGRQLASYLRATAISFLKTTKLWYV